MVKDNAEIIKQMLGDKNLTVLAGNDESFDYGRLPFKIPSLDKLTGGGIPRKRMTIIFGPSGVGKSYLASQVAKGVQEDGGLVGWIDTEASWDIAWMERCGLDTEKILVTQPKSGEKAFETARAFMKAGVDLVVMDSMAGLVPDAVNDEDFSYNPMAWQARFCNRSIPRLIPHLQSGTAFVLINQVRSSIGPVALGQLVGGEAQKFFAHSMIQVARESWINDPPSSTTRVGFNIKATLRKSKVDSEHFSNVVVPFKMDGGIDILETFIREALDKGLVKQAGAWYNWGEERMQGMNGVKQYFMDNPEQQEIMKQAVMDAS